MAMATTLVAAPPKQVRRVGVRRRRWVWALVVGVPLVILLVYFGISLYVADKLSHPTRSAIVTTPAAFGLPFEEVQFNSTDGITLRGWFIDSPGQKTILMMHGRNGVRDGPPAMDIMNLLVKHNYDVFMFDFRGHGTSGGDRYSIGPWETRDVAGALAYLKTRGVAQVGAHATSMGSSTELLAAVEHPEMVAIVADSPFADLPAILETELPKASGLPGFFNPGIYAMLNLFYGIDIPDNKPVNVMAKLGDRPIFLIHSEVDELIPVSHTYQLQQAGAADPNLSAWIAPGSGHCRAYQNNPDEYSKRLLAFYDKYMK